MEHYKVNSFTSRLKFERRVSVTRAALCRKSIDGRTDGRTRVVCTMYERCRIIADHWTAG